MSDIEARLERIEKAITTMASWLVQAQTGFGAQDARGIDDILFGFADSPSLAAGSGEEGQDG